jgi:hypothetical protein
MTLEDTQEAYFSGIKDAIMLIEQGVLKNDLTFKDSIESLKATLPRAGQELKDGNHE